MEQSVSERGSVGRSDLEDIFACKKVQNESKIAADVKTDWQQSTSLAF